MMMNLFSSFDPSNFILNLSWLGFYISLFFMIMVFSKFWNMILVMKKFLFVEFKILTSSNLSNLVILPLFFSIIIMNLLSLLPFSFCPTAQMSFIFSFSFSLWFSNNLFFMNLLDKFLAHLVPGGSPSGLMPFLVLIELVSNLIRPITLSVRLVANIIAGHLLIHLLTDLMMSVNLVICFFSFFVLLILSLMELGVALIQGYIFVSLLSLYSSEIH